VSDERPASPRGSLALYAAAFVVMLGAGLFLALAARELLRENALLWASIALSAGAMLLAVLSLMFPRRS
jgi:hypothetical protein